MKGNHETDFDILYAQLEKSKLIYNGNLVGTIDFCQSCISDDKLKFLPNEIEVTNSKVIFSYEDNTNDNLMITFTDEPPSENSKIIDYFLFQNGHVIAENCKSWVEIRKIINDFGKNKML